MLTGKQRAYLRSLSMKLEPIFQIGKGGIGNEITDSLSDALEARELIKVSVLDSSGYTAREAAEEIAEKTGADVVATVGKRFVLYRRSKKKPKIEL